MPDPTRRTSHGARVHALAGDFFEAAEALVAKHGADSAEMMLAIATALGLCIGKSARPGCAENLLRAAHDVMRTTALLSEGSKDARSN